MTAFETEVLNVLRGLLNNKHLSLGDLVYNVREREGEGWEGPAVKAWSDAVVAAEAMLKRLEAPAVPAVVVDANARLDKFVASFRAALLESYREIDATITPDQAVCVVMHCVDAAIEEIKS